MYVSAASAVLHHGDARDFVHAMELVIQQCNSELAVIVNQRHNASGEDVDAYNAGARAIEEYRDFAKQAIHLHKKCEGSRRALLAELRGSPEAVLQDFGAALATDDYSQLAL